MSASSRRHDIDAIRVFAFALLIVYHCAMAYVAEWDWHVKSSYTAEWLQWPMLFLSRWRMELLFVVSGLALAFMHRGRRPGALARLRSKRLLLPLLVGVAVVVPLQPYCQGVSKGLVEPGFWHFLGRYWSRAPWPAGAFDGWQYGWTWNHLWYLPYLWVYTLLLLAVLALARPGAARLPRQALSRLRGAGLLFLPGLPLALWAMLMQSRFPDSHDLIHDWFLHGIYFACFAYGYVLAGDEGLWRELEQLRRRSLGWALACFGTYLLLNLLTPDQPAPLPLVAIRLARWSYCWLAIAAILGWGRRYLNRPFPWLSYANEAVFPWYMLHQTLIVGLVYLLAPLRLGALLEPLLVFAGTIGGCVLLHEVIRRVDWLRPCFGLKPRPAQVGRAPALKSAGSVPRQT